MKVAALVVADANRRGVFVLTFIVVVLLHFRLGVVMVVVVVMKGVVIMRVVVLLIVLDELIDIKKGVKIVGILLLLQPTSYRANRLEGPSAAWRCLPSSRR